MIIETKDLVKEYSGRRVVNRVSITVEQGSVVGLLGPNGAGKTTTFYMIVGIERPDEGVVTLDGDDISSLAMYERARAGIGYLPQEASIFRKMTVEENILIGFTKPQSELHKELVDTMKKIGWNLCLLYTSPSPRD